MIACWKGHSLELLKIVGLEEFKDEKATSLPYGQQRRLEIVRALATHPKLLLLDEPTKGIDVGSKQEIYEIMNELLAEGMSIIMVSSELPELLVIGGDNETLFVQEVIPGTEDVAEN
mgnify:CR=1 FL=1